ncbi:MAG: hypothetical protein OJF49_000248 [Ktedonobacterales bacterium]|jgi:hypothetical protein|nr:MAG: hypothetical protein OJF49_000248 [Ktedonobacterales bacterium]
MQFLTLVLVSSDTEDITAEVERLMKPYDIMTEVEPYKEYLDAVVIEYLARQWSLATSDLENIGRQIQVRRHIECGVDEGGLYWIMTANPVGHWDDWDFLDSQTNVWSVPELPMDLDPSAIVTADGIWHWQDYKRSIAEDENQDLREKDDLREKAYSLIRQYPSCLAVSVWCHR